MKAGCPQQGPRRTLVVFSGVHASPKVMEREAIPPSCGHFDCMCLQSLAHRIEVQALSPSPSALITPVQSTPKGFL